MSSAALAADERLLAEGVEIANVPTFLAVLTQHTGDLRWLDAPYRPRRQRGVGDNDAGGLAEPIQREIRDAALDAILKWKRGEPEKLPTPSPDTLVRILSWLMD